MAKNLPLIKRLDEALNCSNSQSESREIHGLFYRIAQESLNLDQENFYNSLKLRSLIIFDNTQVLERDIKLGLELADELRDNVNLPNLGRGYGRKMRGAMKTEYGLLKKVFSQENDK